MLLLLLPPRMRPGLDAWVGDDSGRRLTTIQGRGISTEKLKPKGGGAIRPDENQQSRIERSSVSTEYGIVLDQNRN